MRARLAPRARRSATSRRRAAPRASSSVGHVRAGGQEHQADESHEDAQRMAVPAAAVVFALAAGIDGQRRRVGHLAAADAGQRLAGAPALAGRVLQGRLESGARLGRRGRRREASHHPDPPVPGLRAARAAVGLEARVRASGTVMSADSPTCIAPANPGGVTPTMTVGTRLTCTVLPMTDGSPPKPPLPVAAGDDGDGRSAEGRSSSSVSGRPRIADTPEPRVVVAGHELAQHLGLGLAVHEQVDLIEGREREDVGEAGVVGAEPLEREQRERRARRASRRRIDGAVVLARPRHATRSRPARCGSRTSGRDPGRQASAGARRTPG